MLLFYARDALIGPRNLLAVTAWWDRSGDTLPPTASRCRAQFLELGALATSATIAETLTGVPDPPWFLAVVARPTRTWRARMADVEPDPAQVEFEADVALVDLLVSPRTDRGHSYGARTPPCIVCRGL